MAKERLRMRQATIGRHEPLLKPIGPETSSFKLCISKSAYLKERYIAVELPTNYFKLDVDYISNQGQCYICATISWATLSCAATPTLGILRRIQIL
jgi:hypothetical protein